MKLRGNSHLFDKIIVISTKIIILNCFLVIWFFAFPTLVLAQMLNPDALGGQIIVDPFNPSWLVYNLDSNNDGRLDPFFMVGPGDPEGFLYRGTRNADGTRTGDQMTIINDLNGYGANSIYMQIIRRCGDGGATEHPFDSWSGCGTMPLPVLDNDILSQWETWFTEMEQRNIVVYLFFYDDSIKISTELVWPLDPTTGNLHPGEQSFIEGIVNSFEHHKNIIWVVGEEVNEIGTDPNNPQDTYITHVKKIAEAIKQADDHNHVIGVHKLGGVTFNEFADDLNIDQFSIQAGTETSDLTYLHNQTINAWNNSQGRYNLTFSEYHATKPPIRNGDRTALRKINWTAAMGGVYILWIGAYDSNFGDPTVGMLQDAGRMRSFFESTTFNEMAPNDSLKFGATDYVLANPGVSYIAYADAVGTLGLRSMTAGTYDLKWLDIVDGDIAAQNNVSVAAGDQTWTPPVSINGSEIALYIRNQSGGGVPIVTPTPTISPTPAPTVTPPAQVQIESFVVSGSNLVYEYNGDGIHASEIIMADGALVYSDDSAVFTDLRAPSPPELFNQTYIRTPNSDNANGNLSLSVTPDRDALIYVGIDISAFLPSPSWLDSWTDSGILLDTTGVLFRLYYKSVSAHTPLSLGVNYGTRMYTIILVPQQTSSPTPTPGLDPNDLTGEGNVDLNDIILLIQYIFDSSTPIAQGANPNIDGVNGVNLLDVIALIGIIFS